MNPVVGVLALQGDVPEHLRALEAAGARTLTVRRPDELHQVDGLVVVAADEYACDVLRRRDECRELVAAKVGQV